MDTFQLFLLILSYFCLWNICCVFALNCEHGSHGGTGTVRLTFSREALLQLNNVQCCPSPRFVNIPNEIKVNPNASVVFKDKKRRRGRRGGVRKRLRRFKFQPTLPSIILSNVRSIRPNGRNLNFEELLAYVNFVSEFRDACLLCLSETWLCDNINDDSLELPGFGVPFRTDRDKLETRKTRGGGVCLYVNERWCSHSNVLVRKETCSADVELLSVSLRPRYLPREFGQIFVTVCYIPPSANAARAADEISDCVRALQLISADAPCFILGDFNDCNLQTVLPAFKQYVTCPSRQNRKLDLCFGNISNAYKSFPLPAIGTSDHNSIHLIPAYKPKIKTMPIVKKRVKEWTSDSEDKLKGCFECTDWNVFIDSSESIDEATDVIHSYISFCEDMIVPTKTVKVYPNNKPWVTISLKSLLNKKKIAFQTGDKTEIKNSQRILQKEIREAKLKFKEKVESQFQRGNLADAWKGLKTLSGQTKVKPSLMALSLDEEKNFSEKLNEFYCRFERDDIKQDLENVLSDLKNKCSESEDDDVDDDDCFVDKKDVFFLFCKLHTKKAVGVDGVGGRLLKSCAKELCDVFSILFTWSLKESRVPYLWKKSIICPVPKTKKPKSLNEYRPVALTPIVMKCFERIVLKRILDFTSPHHDPYQFAYKPNRGTNDATLTLLHHAYTHLEKPRSFVRILFIDFSSAFNTILPQLLARKLLSYNVRPKLILWIMSFLVNRTQSVRFQSTLSSEKSTSVGSPQGTVLSPFLFTLYTNDCTGSDSVPLIKYSDDSAIEDLSNSDFVYFKQVELFSSWCKQNFLNLNVDKTKEIVIDFRRNSPPVSDLYIDGVKVERVNEYKYLGTVIDHKLNFVANTDLINKKCQSRIFLLHKLRNLQLNSFILQDFYRCFIESVLTFSFICWYGSLGVRNKSVLNKIVSVCSKVVGIKQASLNELYEWRVKKKARKIASDSMHVLAKYYELLPSRRRYRVPRFRTLRTKNSFIPNSILLINK